MALATEPPVRLDLAMFTDDDKLIEAAWLVSDGVTPVAIATARMTMRFEPTIDPDTGEPLPAIVHAIETTDPTDPGGWIDAAGLTYGVISVTVPNTLWPTVDGRRGAWDLVAVSATQRQRCLLRGKFLAEEGISVSLLEGSP
jgi:hypothetical protein